MQRHAPQGHYKKKTINHIWPADAISMNHKRIATPQGEDEGYRVHNDTYMLITRRAVENIIAQTAGRDEQYTLGENRHSRLRSKASRSSTRQSEDHLQPTTTIQTPANHANRGTGTSNALYNSDGVGRATKIAMSTLRATSIGSFKKCVKSYKLSKLERPKGTLPAKRPKELSAKTYTRGSVTTRPDKVKIIIRKSDEEFKAGPNNFESAEWDLIPPRCYPTETDQIPLLPSQQEITRVESNIHILVR